MNFEIEQQKRVSELEQIITGFLPKEDGLYKTVMEAMNYSVMAGGKRIRPMLMLETFRLFGKGRDTAVLNRFIAAIEMIHTYSLVHDDLPAMDDDEYRRGRKTTHIVYGEAMAILAGDGLLTYAFETAGGAYDEMDETSNTLDSYKRVMKSYKTLAEKAGIYGMIGGQVIDIESEGIHASKERLDRMYRLKTSALIEASMMIGAILGGADDGEAAIIERIAGDIGLAFQIMDDILDVTSSGEVLGKPVHSDEKNDKSTYVALMGAGKAKEEVAYVTDRALKAYRSLPYENEYLEMLIIKLMNREK